MDTLQDSTLLGFTALLGSDAPAPGGGSAAALAGSLGAALCGMVANLTLGREKYADVQVFAGTSAAEADALRVRFLDAIDTDTAAFRTLSAALALPKQNDGQKAARTAAIQQALVSCTESPLSVMRLSGDALRLTESLIGRSNENAVSDLGVAALCLKSALQSAWLNVLINLGSLKDSEAVSRYRAEGEALLSALLPLADRCYDAVVGRLS